jgi:hypothetical protein
MPNTAKSTVAWNGVILHHVTEPNISPNGGDVGLLRGMSPTNEPHGFQTDLKPGYDIDFGVPVLQGSQEVRWDQLAESNTEGDFTVSTSGMTFIYSCMVAHCSEKIDAKRGMMWAVKLVAKNKRAL